MSQDQMLVTLTVAQLRDVVTEGVTLALANLEQSKPTPNGKACGTPAEVAAHTKIPVETVQNLVKHGTLTNYGSSKAYLISWVALEQYLKQPQPRQGE